MSGQQLTEESASHRFKRKLKHALGPWGVFFEGFVKHPVMVGSIIPSSGYTIDKMLDPANDTTIGLTMAGALTPAGLGGCVIELMDRGLVDFVISTGANLYHDLHYAMHFTLHRGSPFLDDVELYELTRAALDSD